MADRPLRDVIADEPPRRGVPGWIWGCGGGCLLVVLIAVGVSVYFFNRVQKEFGPETAWPELRQVVPFSDPPPAGLTAFRMNPAAMARSFGRIFGASDEDLAHLDTGRTVGVVAEAERWIALFVIEEAARSPFDSLPAGSEALEFELQGRTVPARRFKPEEHREDLRLAGLAQEHSVVAIDLGVRDGERLSLNVQSQAGEITIPELQEFMEPFDLWATLDEAPPPAPASGATPPAPGDADAPPEPPGDGGR